MRTIRLGCKTSYSALLPSLAWLAALGTFLLATAPRRAAELPATLHLDLWPEVPPAMKPDPALEARIHELLADMSLEQKVGQLIQADIASVTPDDLRHYPLGSTLNGGNSSPSKNEFAPPSEWLTLADRFYEASVDRAPGTRVIPTLWGTDAVHGHNNLVGARWSGHRRLERARANSRLHKCQLPAALLGAGGSVELSCGVCERAAFPSSPCDSTGRVSPVRLLPRQPTQGPSSTRTPS